MGIAHPTHHHLEMGRGKDQRKRVEEKSRGKEQR
jgi:hypothetical protein